MIMVYPTHVFAYYSVSKYFGKKNNPYIEHFNLARKLINWKRHLIFLSHGFSEEKCWHDALKALESSIIKSEVN